MGPTCGPCPPPVAFFMVFFKIALKPRLLLFEQRQHCTALKACCREKVAHSPGWYDANAADLAQSPQLLMQRALDVAHMPDGWALLQRWAELALDMRSTWA